MILIQVMLCQSDLILLHKWGLDDSQSHTTVVSFCIMTLCSVGQGRRPCVGKVFDFLEVLQLGDLYYFSI